MSTTRETRFGWVPAVLCLLVAVYTLALPTLALVVQKLIPTGSFAQLGAVIAAPIAEGVLLFAAFGLAIATLFVVRRVAPGTRGRVRLAVAAIATIFHAISIPIAAWLFVSAVMAAAARGFATIDPGDATMTMSRGIEIAFYATAVASVLSILLALGAAIGGWFLVSRKIRRAVWLVIDGIILVAFVFVTITLPIDPPDDQPDAAVLAAIRLAVTALFAVRLAAWLLAPLLDSVESIGFRPLIAARHLRARKSSFLATIGALSILAVASSSCSLTTTLSVMGGFRNDLKRKILGNNAHVVVDKEHATFEGWQPVLDRVEATEGVVGASPYVAGEVMVTSASNLAGAVLRGVDPDLIRRVTDLESNMRQGRIEYLESPERLLDLPTETARDIPLEAPALGTKQRRGDRDPLEPDEPGGGAIRDIDELLGPLEGAGDDVRVGDDGGSTGPTKDVLPGIIVGQELARTLRLYVGDEVNVVSPLGELGPSGPMPKSRPFRVAGVFYSGMYEYDMKYAYVLLPTAQRFLNTGDAISGIEVKVSDVERAPRVAAALRRAIGRGDLRVRDWQDLNKNLFGALALEKLAMFITLGIAILVAGFCVFGTLTLMVQEKGREVGVLKAMGAPSKAIVAVFMIEGLLIGLFGSIIGLGVGFVVCFAAEHFGVNMNPEVYYIDRLPVHIDPIEFTLVGLASAVVCLVATIFPALLASKLRPVDALRYD